jgi:lipoprotein-anchoring transpeptidase ErfK/SrfK
VKPLRVILTALSVLPFLATGPAGAATNKLLPARVHIAGVQVGGLAQPAATRAVARAFAQPLKVTIDKRTFTLSPPRLATPYIDGAVRRAAAAKPGSRVALVVSVHGGSVRAVVAKLAAQVDHHAAAGDLALQLRNGAPYVAPGAYGRSLDAGNVLRHVVHALTVNSRAPLHFSTKSVMPHAFAAASSHIIVINRGQNVLRLYRGTTLWREFHVATGQAAYPTPSGRFSIIVKWKDPWWYPPASPWAAGESPVPPGPGNPLGTRWMGISAPGVGIHGTPEPQSIGYSESHGCIRMLIPQAEWLFDHVDVGTTVFIV